MANADFRGTPGIVPQISRVTTSDGAAVVGQEIAINNDGTYLLEVEVICTRKSGDLGTPGDGACYTRTQRVKKVDGVVSIAVAQTSYTNQDQTGWGVSFSVSAGAVRVSVQGATGNTVDWTIKSGLHRQL
jgi:hypothetical protein